MRQGVLLLVSLVLWSGDRLTGQNLILRDLTLVSGAAIDRMDIQGVQLADGRRIAWDAVLRGDAGDRQPDFDRWLAEVGEPLFRIGRRLKSGDHGSLQPWADQLAARAARESAPSPALYLARSAQVQDRLHFGQRAAAVIPLLELLALRESAPELKRLDRLTGLRFADQGICENLIPVWFDPESAGRVVAMLESTGEPVSPAATVYRQSLKTAAGGQTRPTAGDAVASEIAWWPVIHRAQVALAEGDAATVLADLDPDRLTETPVAHAVALYYSGLAARNGRSPNQAQPVQWALVLLSVPALYEDRFPELSAAAMDAVVDHPQFRDNRQFDGLRDELKNRYRNTVFGRKYQ